MRNKGYTFAEVLVYGNVFHIRLWVQNLIGYCTVQSCHNSLVRLHTLLDICSLVLHNCVVTGLYSTVP